MKKTTLTIFLILMGLTGSCQTSKLPKKMPMNFMVVHEELNGSTGESKKTVILGSALKTKMPGVTILYVSLSEMENLYQVFKKNEFASIRTQDITTNDRSGHTITLDLGILNKRIEKADVGSSYIVPSDQQRFNNCLESLKEFIRSKVEEANK